MVADANSADDGRPDVEAGAGAIPPSRYADRIDRLAADASEARASTSVASDPDRVAARDVARDGLGAVVACYVEARTSDDPPRFSERELAGLNQATRDWLTCYARHLGVDHDADATVRSAAELLLATHDVVEVAARLTGVPHPGA
jgi:hypothetical protein